MFCMLKKKSIYPFNVLKHHSKRENQVKFVMIPKGERWHYPAVINTISIAKGNNIKK